LKLAYEANPVHSRALGLLRQDDDLGGPDRNLVRQFDDAVRRDVCEEAHMNPRRHAPRVACLCTTGAHRRSSEHTPQLRQAASAAPSRSPSSVGLRFLLRVPWPSLRTSHPARGGRRRGITSCFASDLYGGVGLHCGYPSRRRSGACPVDLRPSVSSPSSRRPGAVRAAFAMTRRRPMRIVGEWTTLGSKPRRLRFEVTRRVQRRGGVQPIEAFARALLITVLAPLVAQLARTLPLER